MARIATYNCNSIRNNSEIVKSLLLNVDILFLQELMLEKRDLSILNDFNDDFRHVAYVNDRESDGICEGRPSKGVAIFWRAHLSPLVSPLLINDSLIGIFLETRLFKILLLNVYLPCDMQTPAALEDFKSSLAEIYTVIRESNVNQVILAGDFNAAPFKGRFWKLLIEFIESLSLHTVTDYFPKDTFTYLCPSKNSTSWLDHIVCSQGMKEKIMDVAVNYEIALYDHFPMFFYVDIVLDASFAGVKEDMIREFVNWNKMTPTDKKNISASIDNEIDNMSLLNHDIFLCNKMNCNDLCHRNSLNGLFEIIKKILLKSTE